MEIIQNVNNEENKSNENIPGLTGNKIQNLQYLIDENIEKKKNTGKDNFITEDKCEINFNEHIDISNFNISVDHLDVQQRSKIDELINKYKSLFAKDKYDVGSVKGYEAHIDLLVDTCWGVTPNSEMLC